MRENMGIYRGKRKDTGEWVEGNLIESDNSHYPMVLIGHVITSRDKHTNALSFDGFDLCEVDPSTVCQFTGLLDKNGKRIFEGAIMAFAAYGFDYVGSVEIVDGNACVMCKHASPFLDQAVSKSGAYIIGNIHDNPELLEVNENDRHRPILPLPRSRPTTNQRVCGDIQRDASDEVRYPPEHHCQV